MTRHLLAVVALLMSFTAAGFAQAAVEGALTHGIASGAGSSLGTALGRATGQLAGRVGQQTSAVGSQKIINVKPGAPGAKAAKAGMMPTQGASTGSMIASIEGGENQQPSCSTAVKAEAKPTDAKGPVSGASQTQNCVNTQAADAHPAVITLPAPK